MQKGHKDQTRLFAGVLTSLCALSMLWWASLGQQAPKDLGVQVGVSRPYTYIAILERSWGRGQKTKKSQMLSAFPGETKHHLKGL